MKEERKNVHNPEADICETKTHTHSHNCDCCEKEPRSHRHECTGEHCEIHAHSHECTGEHCEIHAHNHECTGEHCEIYAHSHRCGCESRETESHDHNEEIAACGCHKGHTKVCSCGCGCREEKDSGEHKIRDIVILSIGFLSLVASFIISEIAPSGIWQYLDFGIIAVLLCGVPIAINAFGALIKGRGMGRITANLLITVSILACITLQALIWAGVLQTEVGHSHSYVFAAGEIAWLMSLGEIIEEFTVGKARSGIERLVSLTPVTAKVREGDVLVERAVSEVKAGDVVEIFPGDVISVDGEIISGVSAVDESIMTGESIPVDKTTGDSVFGGTLNQSGHLVVRVTRSHEEMAVNKLRRLVEEAEGKRAPIAKLADKAAKFIVPGAILLCVVIFLLNYFWISKGELVPSVIRGITMLVVFCPCALALATPTAVAAALGNAAKKGILIKSGAVIEAMSGVKTIAFDKTGTLTEGKLTVDALIADGVSEEELIGLAGACESGSLHPIAKAIYAYCQGKAEIQTADEIVEIRGSGVSATVGDRKVSVLKWSDIKDKASERLKKNAEAWIKDGKTVTAVVRDDKAIGIFALSDNLRNTAAEAVGELKNMGVKTAMLTGDNALAAEGIAKKVGVDETFAALLPEQKLQILDEFKRGDKKVCMVGDGVNDAPALAAADCSIAMGALGSDVAIETASMSLLGNDLRRIPQLLRLAKKMMAKIKLNITMSMGINIIVVILSAIGLLTPVTGALVHNLSSILVVLNSSLLLLYQRDKKEEISRLRSK